MGELGARRAPSDAGARATVELVRSYRPVNEQEERDRERILRLLEREDVWGRDNDRAHLTSSAWVCDASASRVLMCWHLTYRSWSWLGGHADCERDLLAVALREVGEESGLTRLEPALRRPISLEVLAVDGHEKRGRYVGSHVHLNLTWLVVADPAEPLRPKPDENRALRWFSPEGAVEASAEPWMRERIYPKLNAAMRAWAEGSARGGGAPGSPGRTAAGGTGEAGGPR